ncbi:MAG: alpha/beta hydrolase [Acetobacteraceae bacterium]|nr:alpha/beta hydrolase [Acetobacteraceae bacterium]
MLLPALSSISARAEMHPLAQHLASRFRCVIPDWPGFGDHPREAVALSPDAMRRFLYAFIHKNLRSPAVGIAAGHAATYLIQAASHHPSRFSHLVLIAPTWRGPLPTMLGETRRGLCDAIRHTIEWPIIGEALYRLNVSRPVVASMLRSHVYADARKVTPDVIAAKLSITRHPRARFATAAFVTGALDPVRSRDEFVRLFEASLPPILMLRPRKGRPRSAAEMDALSAIGRVATVTIPGALAAHEEEPEALARAIAEFVVAT